MNNVKINKRSLSENWRESIVEDLKGCKKIKTDLSEVNPLEFIPDGSPRSIVKAATLVIRSQGVVKTSRATGIPRSSLYSVMSDDSNPTLDTIATILASSGYELAVVPSVKNEKKSASF